MQPYKLGQMFWEFFFPFFLRFSMKVKEYDDLEAYYVEIEPHLLIQECKNTFILLTIQRAIKEAKNETHYCSAVWNDQGQLVFALFSFSNSILYGSFLLDDQFEAVDASLEKFIAQEKHKGLSWGHAFQPALSRMQKYLVEHTDIHLKIIDEVCAYDIREVQWSSRSLELKADPTTQLRVATDSFDFIEAWTDEFLDETTETENMIRVPTAALGIDQQIQEKSIYVLYHHDEPVCMAWKRRPTKHGIAISLVYTPKNKRGRGYANCCVSMLTEELLTQYQYVTLFVDGKQNLEDNLYTRVGYKRIGEGGRLLVTDAEYDARM